MVRNQVPRRHEKRSIRYHAATVYPEACMNVSLKSLGVDRLSVAERLVLVEELWDSIAASTPISDAQRTELDRRLADHKANPDDVVSWEEVDSSITARLNT